MNEPDMRRLAQLDLLDIPLGPPGPERPRKMQKTAERSLAMIENKGRLKRANVSAQETGLAQTFLLRSAPGKTIYKQQTREGLRQPMYHARRGNFMLRIFGTNPRHPLESTTLKTSNVTGSTENPGITHKPQTALYYTIPI